MTESRYFTVACPECGWIGSSEHAEGGDPIADAGDYSELLCPQCLVCEGTPTELVDVEEVASGMSDDINTTEARELFAKTTQGPYHVSGGGYLEICNHDNARVARCYGSGKVDDATCEANAEWIAYAHNQWEEMVKTIERLKHFEKCVADAMQLEPMTCKQMIDLAIRELRIKRGETID